MQHLIKQNEEINMNTYITDTLGNTYAVRATRKQVSAMPQIKIGLMKIIKATAKLRSDAKLNITVKNLVIREGKLTYL
jgi:hypothetical protein